MTINGLCDLPQGVAGLQSVIAVVDVCWILKDQAALQVVLVEFHLGPDVVVLNDLLLLEEPFQFGVRVASHCELDAGVETLLRLGQSQDDWGNCTKKEGKKKLLKERRLYEFKKR